MLDTEGKAKEMMSVLRDDPDSFAEMAREHSIADTREQGGVIGKVLRGSLKTDVEAKVFNAAVGDLLGPFPSPDRSFYEIFAVNAKYPADAGRGNRGRGAPPAARGMAAGEGAGTHHRGALGATALAQMLTDASSRTLASPRRFSVARSRSFRRSRGTNSSGWPSTRESRFFAFGDTVCNAGEPADGLFVIKSGSVRIFTEEHGKEISMGVRKEARCLPKSPCCATTGMNPRCAPRPRPSCCSSRARRSSRSLPQNRGAHDFVTSYVAISSAGGFVARLFDLRGKVSKSELEEFVRSVGVKRIGAGKEILKQDSREDRRLYVVRQGEVRIVRSEDGTEYPLATLGPGEIFGEKACLMRQEQMASVIARHRHDAAGDSREDRSFHPGAQPEAARGAGRTHPLHRAGTASAEEAGRATQAAGRCSICSPSPNSARRSSSASRWVEQAEEMDCGAACLAMLCRHYGIAMTLGKLRELANVTTQGATLDSLARAGESLGFTTRGVQCTYRIAAGLRAAVHRALGGLSLRRGVRRLEASRSGWPTRRSASRR